LAKLEYHCKETQVFGDSSQGPRDKEKIGVKARKALGGRPSKDRDIAKKVPTAAKINWTTILSEVTEFRHQPGGLWKESLSHRRRKKKKKGIAR